MLLTFTAEISTFINETENLSKEIPSSQKPWPIMCGRERRVRQKPWAVPSKQGKTGSVGWTGKSVVPSGDGPQRLQEGTGILCTWVWLSSFLAVVTKQLTRSSLREGGFISTQRSEDMNCHGRRNVVL